MNDDYKEQVKRMALDEETFVRLSIKGPGGRGKPSPSHEMPWRQVSVRPVLIKNERYLQFSYFSDRQDITKNYAGREAEQKLDEALALPFSALHVQSTTGDLAVQITKKGKAILHHKPVATGQQAKLAHDQSKQVPLPADKPDAFLQAIGIMDEQGRVRASMQDKFSQVNEFLKLLEHSGELERLGGTRAGASPARTGVIHHAPTEGRGAPSIHRGATGRPAPPVNILDCGCGSAYLSLATYHYLNDILGIPARLVGIDVNESLIQKDNEQSERLGFSNACFQRSAIINYRPDESPDIVLALHACDTASDEAIAQGIVWQSRLILCAPCCHHELNRQLHTREPFAPVLRHGILKERMADILTDAFRALVLRMMGYRTDVVEFVSSEHTNRNLMIRAVKLEKPEQDTARFVREYNELKAFWGVTPYIEQLLGEQFATLVNNAPGGEGHFT